MKQRNYKSHFWACLLGGSKIQSSAKIALDGNSHLITFPTDTAVAVSDRRRMKPKWGLMLAAEGRALTHWFHNFPCQQGISSRNGPISLITVSVLAIMVLTLQHPTERALMMDGMNEDKDSFDAFADESGYLENLVLELADGTNIVDPESLQHKLSVIAEDVETVEPPMPVYDISAISSENTCQQSQVATVMNGWMRLSTRMILKWNLVTFISPKLSTLPFLSFIISSSAPSHSDIGNAFSTGFYCFSIVHVLLFRQRYFRPVYSELSVS
ncbi:hypothetical protein C8J56DRAFT_898854 [Mycena floridula]|nr:hypothetical protein C8J56DRAFT_898854 [Mycena floridula]